MYSLEVNTRPTQIIQTDIKVKSSKLKTILKPITNVVKLEIPIACKLIL